MNNLTKKMRVIISLLSIISLTGATHIATAQSPASNLESQFAFELLLDVAPQHLSLIHI